MSNNESFEQERSAKVQHVHHVWFDIASFHGLALCAQSTMREAADLPGDEAKRAALRELANDLEPAIKCVAGVKQRFAEVFGLATTTKRVAE